MATTARFPAWAKNIDNTDRKVQRDYQTPAYAASIAIATKQQCQRTLVAITLTGALTLTIGVGTSTTAPFVGDEIEFLIKSDASIRVVTFSTGFQPAGTLSTVASKTVSARFMFDGTGWQEMSRAIQA
jgi:hypothetical protein